MRNLKYFTSLAVSSVVLIIIMYHLPISLGDRRNRITRGRIGFQVRLSSVMKRIVVPELAEPRPPSPKEKQTSTALLMICWNI